VKVGIAQSCVTRCYGADTTRQEAKVTTADDTAVQVYELSEVADILGVSTRTIQRMVADGRLPAVHLGQRITRVTHQALTGLLDNRQVTR
jgi:excisionase family DNA binding protein